MVQYPQVSTVNVDGPPRKPEVFHGSNSDPVQGVVKCTRVYPEVSGLRR